MSRWVLALLIALATLSAQAQAACGTATETILMAGQTIAVGSVVVENDGQNLYVTYRTDGNWLITETHLAVATRPEDLPQTPKGNAIPGQFAYQTSHDPGVTEVTHTIDVTAWPAGTPLYIAAHSVVVSAAGSETAWGQGTAFPGKNWAMYFGHTVQTCEPPPQYPGIIEFDRPDVTILEDGVSVVLRLVRHDGSDGDVTVTFAYEDLGATRDDDYYPATTTVTFADGETEKQIEVFILDDQADESDEPFRIRIEDVVGAQVGTQREMTCTIIDNDETPTYPGVLSFPADIFYVGEDEPLVTIEVQRTDGSDGAISVDYIITGETATDGSDYQAVNGTLYFADGETSKSFDIAILDDGDDEEDETIRLELTNVIGATLGAQASAQVVILDNDGLIPE
jgi:hypothetical protein